MALFRISDAFEIRVIRVQAPCVEEALKIAVEQMERYSLDFECEFSGVVNVFEAGSDMFEEYGEVFSLTGESDSIFESMFEMKLRAPLGVLNHCTNSK